jgi:hypothetical protein
MADEKKPKIDLKTRLQKMGGTAAVPAGGPAVGAAAVPMPNQPASIPVPGRSAPTPPPAIPLPPGVGMSQRPPAYDPSNPLAAAVASNLRTAPPPVAVARPEPQRIEVDEGAIHDARRSVRKQMAVIAFGLCIVTGGIGWAGGGAQGQSNRRALAKTDAVQLRDSVNKAKDTLNAISDKLDAGIASLKGKQFPDSLSKDLAALNVDFDGGQLAGRHFDGFSHDTTAELVDFVQSVTSINKEKEIVQGLLSQLQKPLSESFKVGDQAPTVTNAVIIDKDNAAAGALFARLVTPFTPTKDAPNPPDKLTLINPKSGGNTQLPRYTGGDIKGAVAMTIIPATVEAVYPSAEKGQVFQLANGLGSLKRKIKAAAGSSDNGLTTTEDTTDMVTKAARLADDLGKVQ